LAVAIGDSVGWWRWWPATMEACGSGW